MEAPHTYADWAAVIDAFRSRENDAETLQAMRGGTIEWQSGVAERLAKRLIDAVNFRMNAASDRFQRDLSRAGGQEGAVVQAILALRKEMALLCETMDLPVLPEGDRAHYRRLVLQQADKMQASLEDSAKRDRSGRLASLIRNHKVNAF